MDVVTANDVLASSAAPISPNLAAWVIVYITAHVGLSIAERIRKVRDVKWLGFLASVLGAGAGAFIAMFVVGLVLDVGSPTAAPGYVGLATAFFVTMFINEGIADLVSRIRGGRTWQRRGVSLLVAVVIAVIVWFVAYYVFNVVLPGGP